MSANRWVWRLAMVAVASASPAFAQEAIRWERNLETAKQVAAQSNRLVLVHFGATWCEPCQRLSQTVFRDPAVDRALSAHYVPVKLNFDYFPSTARQYGVTTIPTDVIITPQGQMIERVSSPLNTAQYVATMNQIAANVARQPGEGSRQAPAAMVAQTPASYSPSTAPPGQPVASTNPGAGRDRYADYFNRQQTAPPPAVTPPQAVAQSPQWPANGPHSAAGPYPPEVNPRQPVFGATPPQYSRFSNPYAGLGQEPMAAQQPARDMLASNPAPAAAPSDAMEASYRGSRVEQASLQPTQAVQLPPGSPPLGLEGFCPVSLSERRVWSTGDVRWGAIHRGRTYLFVGPEEQRRFLDNPDRFGPVMSGNDPVLALDQRQSIPGRRQHGVFFGGRVYLFASETTLEQFSQNPNRYAADVMQAMR